MSNFEIITLAQLLKRLEQYNHKELHVHHTWQPDHKTYNTKPDGVYWQEAMKKYHVETNGWTDIAPHVTLLPDGRFVTGRDFAKNPASIKGYNTGAFMVEMIGDFDVGRDKLEGAQLESILGLAKWFDDKGRYVRFHRENSPKTCPGSGIDKAAFMAAARKMEVNSVVLKKGDKGPEVKNLQKDLIALDYGQYMEPYGADSSFGGATQSALKAMQKANGLVDSGIADTLTLAKINELLKAKAKPAEPDYKKLYEEACLKIDQIKNIIG